MKLMVCMIMVFIAAGALTAQTIGVNRTPSWLIDSKRVSMHHSLSFSYGSRYDAYQTLYSNSIQYALSSKLTLSGILGYYQLGGKSHNYKSMLHGIGFTYYPSKYLKIEFMYRGSSPISHPGGTSGVPVLDGK